MIGLASGLLALAGLLAERAVASARSDRLTKRLGIERLEQPLGSPDPLVLVVVSVMIAGLVAGPLSAVVAWCASRCSPTSCDGAGVRRCDSGRPSRSPTP